MNVSRETLNPAQRTLHRLTLMHQERKHGSKNGWVVDDHTYYYGVTHITKRGIVTGDVFTDGPASWNTVGSFRIGIDGKVSRFDFLPPAIITILNDELEIV